MGTRIEFGVGCFAFEWLDDLGERSGTDWAEDVIDVLSSLPNVSSIDASASHYFLRDREPGDDFRTAASAYPHPHHASVRFDITIPRRHHELVPKGMTASENYRVHIEYRYDSPVAYVVPLDHVSDEGSGSTGVMLVRQHLAEHLPESGKVKFSFAGPSPFHADFCLVAGVGADMTEVLECDLLPSRGYDDIFFRYDPDSFDDINEAFTALRQDIGHELSLYYYLIRKRNGRNQTAVEVAQQAHELVSLHTEKGAKSRWRRLFQSGAQARQLALEVMDAELADAWDLQLAENNVQATYKSGEGFLRTYVDPVATHSLSPLIVNARSIVQQLESGRTKELEITLVSAATVGGALAGGLISAAVTFMGPAG